MAQKKPFQIGDPLQIQRRCNATTTGACATKSSQDSRSSQSRGTVDHEKNLQGVEGRGREEDVFDFFVLFGEKRGL